MKNRIIFSLLIITCFFACKPSLEKGSADQKLQAKADSLLSQLTLEEKIAMIHARTKFSTGAVPRLGIPSLRMSDGPCGVRMEINLDNFDPIGWGNDDGIYLPALTAVASTWNPELAEETGTILGQETRIRGKHIQLAPGINIHRSPLNGRNWEYMSEDPFLISKLVVPLIQGLQSNGVAACVKHFALNNQETNRCTVNVKADERALREIYLPGFEAAVKEGGALAVMGSYNKFRGQYATYNKHLVQDILKGEWGFKGTVISDWDAAHNTLEAGNDGLDIEMGTERPYDKYFMAKPMFDAVKQGLVSEKSIDDKVRRILYVMLKLNAINEAPFDTTGMRAKLAIPKRCMATRKVAEEAIVLLKNSNNILPLDISKMKSLAVIGANAIAKHSFGGGSTTIEARYEITPLEGLQKKLGNKVKINYTPGYPQTLKSDWQNYDNTLDTISPKMIAEAVEVAKKSDYVIIFGGLNHNFKLEAEGVDRKNMKLPYGQDLLISEVVKANPKTIVVLLCGSPVELGGWFHSVPGLLQNSFLGMEAGNALAEVIFGDVNPSGKLPYTFPKKLADSPDHALGEYPGKDGIIHYNEGLYVGYRYYDSKKVEPMFPFGYGLSYTQFKYSDLTVPKEIIGSSDSVVVHFNIKNTGQYDGKEVAQLYIHEQKCTFERPLKELKGFAKVSLKAGETKTVKITLNKRAFQFYNPAKKAWVAEPGIFDLLVGSSSRDIRLKGETILK